MLQFVQMYTNNIAIYPGTFDPITLGHIDLLQRASDLFDKIVVAVADNQQKNPLFSLEQRIELASQSLNHIDNIEIKGFAGLLTVFAQQQQAKVILRGLRAVSDFEYEFQMAWMNRRMKRDIETVFLTSNADYAYISSSMVKEIAALGADVSDSVPLPVQQALLKKLAD